MNKKTKTIIWIVVAVVAVAIVGILLSDVLAQANQLDFTEFRDLILAGKINRVYVNAFNWTGYMVSAEGKVVATYTTNAPSVHYYADWAAFVQTLGDKAEALKVEFSDPNAGSVWSSLFPLFSVGIVALVFFFLMRQMSGGNAKAMNIGKTKAHVQSNLKVRFADVAGAPFYCAGFETVVFQGDTQFGGTDTLGTFYNCKSLKKIVFEADITEDLGRGFVQGCSALEEVIFKGNVGKLYGCFNVSSVKRVVFEKNTGELGTTVQGMFEGASKLEEVVFLGTVQKLGAEMFVGCTALKSVYLPATVLKVTGGTGNIWNTFNEFEGTIYTPLTEAEAKAQYGEGWYCGATVVYEAGKSTETAVAVKNGENRLHVTDQAIAYFKYTAASAGSVKITATGATAVVVDADGNALTAGTDGSYTVAAGAVYVKVTVTTDATTASFEVDFTANDGSEGGDDTTGGDDDQTGGTTGDDTTGGDDDQSGGTTGGDAGSSLNPGTGTRPSNPNPGTSLRG